MDLRLRKELIAWIIGSVALLAALCVSDAFISKSEGDTLSIRSPKYYRPPPVDHHNVTLLIYRKLEINLGLMLILH